MNVTSITDPLVSTGTGTARAELAQGLIAAAAWLATHEDSPLPGDDGTVTLQVRVPGETRGQRVAALDEIADRLGVPVTASGSGGLRAVRPFGPVRLAASLDPEGSAHLAARQDALRAAEASGSAA